MRSKILLIGDIMGRPGRHALAQVLPLWKDELGWDAQKDVLIGNVENLAHGKGITLNTMEEMNQLGFDAYTSGNHVFDTGPHSEACFDRQNNIVRPVNYLSVSEDNRTVPGQGYYRFSKNGQQYLVINLGGRLFFEKQFRGEISNPFFAFDEVYQQQAQKDDIIIVDLHAEATSEKNAFGWYADGRATIAYGTHTHIPTADTKILTKGTAYQTDIGMTGARDSVLGVKVENSLAPFLETGKFKLEAPEEGPAIANALLVECEGNQPVNIERLQKEVIV
jgi:metallophosphoesterase (TIGR00282 family)